MAKLIKSHGRIFAVGEILSLCVAYTYYRVCIAVGFTLGESILSGIIWAAWMTFVWAVALWPRDIEVEPTYSTGAAPGATYRGEKDFSDILEPKG